MNVWYVSYGSNICEDRFLCYIYGGAPKGSNKAESGCSDKTPPKITCKKELPYTQYFAKEESKWGKGGVAFIDHEKNPESKTIARQYLITTEQFIEVVEQENNTGNLNIDVDKIIDNGYLDITAGWYGRLIYLGNEAGCPMFTFTDTYNMKNQKITPPSNSYLKIITRGLKELGLTKQEIIDYFLTTKGIEGYFSGDLLSHYIFD
ncbi:hypothetical protein [Lentibacillus salicampi]|uniref:Histone deacetylase n=1 Tax=Lentibacillus salicampi TaxID=175306 RepID=A0A4Y9AAF6_9BACI|nr:hypothetical protein [Lentibacillus salicampi]TFJ91344.1 hypothetical protein E4U82_18115 [Lentibacillus salicampi]